MTWGPKKGQTSVPGVCKYYGICFAEPPGEHCYENWNNNMGSKSVRVLARNFKTCVRDSLLGKIWRPRMKNMRTGIRI